MSCAIELEELSLSVRNRRVDGRLMVAIAGPPGSGKSTLANILVERLNAEEPSCASILSMDGFHYDDLYLTSVGLRQHKGSPDTFDVGGLRHMLLRLKKADEDHIAIPIFDRQLEIARAGASLIRKTTRIVIVEGNYLLLRRGRWAELLGLFDVTAMIVTSEPICRERLTERWRHYKLTPEQIGDKLDGNDLPNGRIVMAESAQPDFLVANE